MPDILPGFEQLTLDLAPDHEGPVVASLVRRAADHPSTRATPVPDSGVDVLYIHGWNDYFFQVHLAEFWESQGTRFHALDLRKYGRSLRRHQIPGYITQLDTYDEEIGAALEVMGHPAPTTASASASSTVAAHATLTANAADQPPAASAADIAQDQSRKQPTATPHSHPGETAEDISSRRPDPHRRKLLLMGHSTGGLTISLWVSTHPGYADAVVLNAPWLEFQTRFVGRRLLEPGVRVHAALAPRSRMLNLDLGLYTRAISSRFDGEWDYDPDLRSDTGWSPTPAWLAAILQGHETVARGLGITVPVLVLLSSTSTPPVLWSEDSLRTDTVLDVAGVARRCADLGNHVTIVRIEGALHDVTLSTAPVPRVLF